MSQVSETIPFAVLERDVTRFVGGEGVFESPPSNPALVRQSEDNRFSRKQEDYLFGRPVEQSQTFEHPQDNPVFQR